MPKAATARAMYCGSRISPHIIRDNAGFLIATAPICRSGWQNYRRSELGFEGDDRIVRVYRPVEEVTSAACIASAEGKPVAGVGHPARFVGPDNASWIVKGHMQNIRVGPTDENGDIPLLADLHIQDGQLIDQIQGGVRDLSCGYTFELDEGPEPDTRPMRKLRRHPSPAGVEAPAQTTNSGDSPAPESFETVCARYRGKDPASVERGKQPHASARANDTRTVRLNSEVEEDNMAKNVKDERDSKIDRLLDLLERLLAKQAADGDEPVEDESSRADPDLISPEADRPVNPIPGADEALERLRALRPLIVAAGDRRAAEDYNNAVRHLKRSRDARRGHRAADAILNELGNRFANYAKEYEQVSVEDFEQRAREYHRQPIVIGKPPRSARETARATDRRARPLSPSEDFEAKARDAREKAMSKK